MKKIHKLPPHLIAQIAAGEVIERPSYALKELIDNSIDANATSIQISIENSGLRKISVTDNGEGMSKEDLLDAIKIHTTSKVLSTDTLTAISSLGFRGEALASIAAISQLTIKSKREEDLAGTEISVQNGKVEKISPVGMPTGTSIEVTNIFSQVPARKKFLKSPQTELRHLIEVFTSFALAFPEIRFSLNHNKKVLFDLAKTDDPLNRFNQLLGNETVAQLIPFTSTDSYLKIKGFLAKPQLSTTTQTKQHIFINKRKVADKVISLALKDAYQNLLDQKHYPIAVLFLDIPYELVDVNVHPRKEQIAFANNQLIYDAVLKSAQQTLSDNNLTFANLSFRNEPLTATFAGQVLKSETQTFSPKVANPKMNFATLSQLHNLYIVAETENGIMFVDQHAAHERILFEQFKKEFIDLKKETYTLPKPIQLKVTPGQNLLLSEFSTELKKVGFIITPPKSLTSPINHITQIPLLFKDRDIPSLINELLESLVEKERITTIDQTTTRIVQFLACKKAIKAGDPINKKEATELIKELEKTQNNTTCPHGRPTTYIFDLREVNKLFKRF